MENSVIKYSYQVAKAAKAALKEVDIPSLIVDHPFIYFGTTIGITYLVAVKLGYVDYVYMYLKYKNLTEPFWLTTHKLHPRFEEWKMGSEAKIPEPIKLDFIKDNPFEWPIHFVDSSNDPNVYRNNPEYDIINIDQEYAELVNWTVDTAVTRGINSPFGSSIFLNMEDYERCPVLVERMVDLDIVMNGGVRDWKFYSETVQDIVFEAKRPYIESWYFMNEYVNNFIQKIRILDSDAYVLVVNRFNLSKFIDAYYGLGIHTLKFPYAKQWLLEPWKDATYEKFLVLRKCYRSSFRVFTKKYCDLQILIPENLQVFKAHQMAFKKMWLDIAMNVPPEILMADVTFIDRMISYGHYMKYMNVFI